MVSSRMRHGDADAKTPPIPPKVTTARGLVTPHTTRPLLRSTLAAALNGTTGHERFKSHRFMTLTRSQHQRHQVGVARRAPMDFGTEAPLAATQGVGFCCVGRTRRLLMRTNDGALDIVHGPLPLSSSIGLLLHAFKEALPGTGAAPAREAAGHGVPGAIAFGHMAPGRSGAKSP